MVFRERLTRSAENSFQLGYQRKTKSIDAELIQTVQDDSELVIKWLLPVRRIGQCWEATRAPVRVLEKGVEWRELTPAPSPFGEQKAINPPYRFSFNVTF